MEINQAEIEFSKAVQLIELNRYDHAEKFLRNALSLDVHHAGAYSHLALIKYNQQKYEEAFNLLQESLKIEAGSYYAFYLLSKTLYAKGKSKEAADTLSSSLQLYPDNVSALSFKSAMFFNKGDFKPALKIVNEALAIEPENSELLVLKSQIVRDLGNKRDAYKIAQDALTINLESGETWLQKGNLKVEWKDYDKARTCFENALRLEPENEKAKEALLKALKLQNGFFHVFEPHVANKLMLPKKSVVLFLIPHTWIGLLLRSFQLQLSDYFSRLGDLFFNLKIYSAHLLSTERKLVAKYFSAVNLIMFLLIAAGVVFSNHTFYLICYATLLLCMAIINYFNDADDHFSKILIGIFLVVITGCIAGFIFSIHKGPVLTLLVLSHFLYNLLYYIRVKVFDLNKRYVEKD